MWHLLGPETELPSPALAGGFLTTGPPEKSQDFFFLTYLFILVGGQLQYCDVADSC